MGKITSTKVGKANVRPINLEELEDKMEELMGESSDCEDILIKKIVELKINRK